FLFSSRRRQTRSKRDWSSDVCSSDLERDEENRAPTANDDSFGVRPGKSVVLPVTRNDTDPDGDILTVSVEGEQPGIGVVTPIREIGRVSCRERADVWSGVGEEATGEE